MFVERVLGLPQGIDSWGVLLRMVHSKRNSQGSYQVTQSSCPPYCDFFQHLGCSPEDTFTFLSDWSNGNIATKKLWTSASTMYKDLCFFFKHIWLHNSNNDNNSNCNNSTFKYAHICLCMFSLPYRDDNRDVRLLQPPYFASVTIFCRKCIWGKQLII